jgi:hypothetical protein
MNYLLLVCSDGVATEEKAATNRDALPAWLDMLQERGIRAYGERLEGPETARTVQVRGDQTIVTDGPFADTKEFIAGFDIVDCADLDEAIAIAAKHPVAQFHVIEVRPFDSSDDYPSSDAFADPRDLAAKLERPVPEGAERYLMFVCADGIPGTDEEEATVRREGQAWLSDLEARGVAVYAHALAPAEMATSVRVRGGETVVSDGPFVETKEFVAGFHVLDCADLDEAVRYAADHPLARFHRCEVRPFWHWA